MRRNHLPQHVGRHHTSFAPEDLTVAEENHGRYALNVVRAGSSGIAIDVNLEDPHLVAHLSGEFLNNGSHHFAWSTPICVKVDQYGFITFDDVAEFFFPVCSHARFDYVLEGTALEMRNRLLDLMAL